MVTSVALAPPLATAYTAPTTLGPRTNATFAFVLAMAPSSAGRGRRRQGEASQGTRARVAVRARVEQGRVVVVVVVARRCRGTGGEKVLMMVLPLLCRRLSETLGCRGARMMREMTGWLNFLAESALMWIPFVLMRVLVQTRRVRH